MKSKPSKNKPLVSFSKQTIANLNMADVRGKGYIEDYNYVVQQLTGDDSQDCDPYPTPVPLHDRPLLSLLGLCPQ
jgi:hypothetical protein